MTSFVDDMVRCSSHNSIFEVFRISLTNSIFIAHMRFERRKTEKLRSVVLGVLGQSLELDTLY